MRNAVIGTIGLLIFATLAVVVYQNQRRFHKPLITTTYQAVMLIDGTLLHGQIDHLGTDFPVLRNAIKVELNEVPGSDQKRYEVTFRRNGPTGADHMIVPATSILYVEPVNPDSAIGQAIQKARPR